MRRSRLNLITVAFMILSVLSFLGLTVAEFRLRSVDIVSVLAVVYEVSLAGTCACLVLQLRRLFKK